MLAAMKAKADKPFDVTCPDCGAILKVDPETRAILSHTPAPRKRTFEDFEAAAKAMRAQDDSRRYGDARYWRQAVIAAMTRL